MRKIKLVHLLTLPDEEREKKSIKSLSRLSDFGIEYIQNINEPYTELPPKETCMYPDRVGLESGYYVRSAPIYGCYLAHKNAVLNEFDDDIDFLLVCECDTHTLIESERFYAELTKICDALEKEKDIVYVNLGESDINQIDSRKKGYIKETIDDALFIVDKTFGTTAVLYQKSSVSSVKEKFLNEKWDAADLWVQEVFKNNRKAYSKTPLIKHTSEFGESLIDRVDTLNYLKVEKKFSLIAEIVFFKKEPVLIYDKLNLFADPFISKESRLNLPYNQDAKNIEINEIQVFCYVDSYLFDRNTYSIMFTGSWFWWSHPLFNKFLESNKFLERQMKVKIYG